MLNIYKASAGSGKTYTLAYEYIKALLAISDKDSGTVTLNHPQCLGTRHVPNRHRYILAITFTNKATEQMKSRIVQELRALATIPAPGDDDANYARQLCAEVGCSRLQLAQSAQTALREVLTDYNEFNVTTIDSFFQRVLRTFARELDRQGDFNVELEDNAVVQKAVDTMIDDYNNNPAAAPKFDKWIYRYLYNQMLKGNRTNFFNRSSPLHRTLVKLVSFICDERFKDHIEQMRRFLAIPDCLDQFHTEVDLVATRLLQQLQERTRQCVDDIGRLGITYKNLNGKQSIKRFITEYFIQATRLPKDDTLFSDKSVIQKLIDRDPETTPFNRGTPSEAEGIELIRDLMVHARACYADLTALQKIDESTVSLGLLGHAWSYLDRLVSENNIVLLSDTNHLLRKIIGEDSTPFIYERMGMKLHHFLIDEFQDTSRMQWQNLQPLVAFGLSDYDSLIIGDEKQSIYRFRNSDSSLLHHEVAQQFAAQFYEVEIIGSAPGQNTNYRSAADIIRFNNAFFSALSQRLEVSGFENVVQDIPDKHADYRGHIRLVPFDAEVYNASHKGCETTEGDDGATQTHTADDAAPDGPLQSMLRQIRSQHDQGQYRWSDIAVLVDTNLEGAQVVDFLTQNNIPVISDESLFIQKSSAVQMVVGVLKLLVNERRPGAKTDTDRHGNHYPTPSQLSRTVSRLEYYRDKGLGLYESLDNAINDEFYIDSTVTQSQSAVAGIEAIKRHKPASLVALVEAIIHQELTADQRDQQMAYLLAFQDYVLSYESRNNASVRGLLNDWECRRDKLSISAATNINKVKVMTIHKSKGLEFKCVHIPYGSWRTVGRTSGRWMTIERLPWRKGANLPPAVYIEMTDRFGTEGSAYHDVYVADTHARLTDQLNKTYVAYTRAEAELTVYYSPTVGIGQEIALTLQQALPQHLDPERPGALSIGQPTVNSHTAHSADDACRTIDIDTYRVTMHQGDRVLTTIDDTLGADRDLDNDDSYDEYHGDEAARLRGIAMHSVLSMVHGRDDLPRALSRVCRSPELTDDDRRYITDTLTAMLDQDEPLTRRWFDTAAHVLTEQTLYDADEDRIRRIDRLVMYDDGTADVIDYKFTTEAEADHRRQVGRYMRLLRGLATGGRTIEHINGYLWYPLQGRIVQVHN